MALNNAQKWRRDKLARIAQEKAQADNSNPYGGASGSEYELLLARLAEHRRTLKDIQSVEEKGRYKAAALADFEPWVAGVMKGGSGAADEVLTTMIAWHVDAGNYAQALNLAAYAIKHGLTMPDQFVRTVPVFIMDELTNAALSGRMAASVGPDNDGLDNAAIAALLARVLKLTEKHDAPDPVRAKLLKAHAYAMLGKLGRSDFDTATLEPRVAQTALAELQRATTLNDAVGVKKDMSKIEGFLKKKAPELLDTVPRTPAAQGKGKAATAKAKSAKSR